MHGIDRRKLSCALFTMAAGMARAGAGWPERTVRVVVPFPANGTTDLVTRAVTAELQRSTSVSFAIDNKPGAGGNLGATEVAHAAGDGHTLLVGTAGTHAINASLDVPTLRESGVVELRNYAATAWFGLFAPAPTPRSVVDKIHQTLREALREPAVRRSIIELGGVPGTMGPEGLTRFAASETARWRRIVKVSGAKAE